MVCGEMWSVLECGCECGTWGFGSGRRSGYGMQEYGVKRGIVRCVMCVGVF